MIIYSLYYYIYRTYVHYTFFTCFIKYLELSEFAKPLWEFIIFFIKEFCNSNMFDFIYSTSKRTKYGQIMYHLMNEKQIIWIKTSFIFNKQNDKKS